MWALALRPLNPATIPGYISALILGHIELVSL